MQQSIVRRRRVSRLFIGMAALGCGAIALPSTAAELRTGEDYIALIIEAEDTISVDERWVLTEPDTPVQSPDPDGNHSDVASGNAYLELLPDNKTDHTTPIPEGAPPWFWNTAGTGPVASYTVDFPEAGRYHMHVRAYTTGTEDNGLHIGLNGAWPSSGMRLQLCAAGSEAWRWTSKQRDSGGQVCGVRKTIYLDVDEPGEHTVQVSAREDGFELDRMMLIKDTSDNTRICAPVFNEADIITCSNGSIEATDELVDLAVGMESSAEEILVGERVDVTATVENLDRFDRAYETELELALNVDEWRVISIDARCTGGDGTFTCVIGEMGPTGSEDGEAFVLSLEALAAGTLTINATASTLQVDDDADNDTARLDVLVDDPVLPTQLAVALDGVPGMVDVDIPALIEFTVSNAGSEETLGATVRVSMSRELAVGPLPADCESIDGGLLCELGALSSGQFRNFSISVSSDQAGDYSIAATASATNADESLAAGSLTVTAPSATDAGNTSGGGTTTGDGTVDSGADTTNGENAGESAGGDDAGSGSDAGAGGDTTAGSDTSGSDTTTNGAPIDKPAVGGALGPIAGLALLLIGLRRRARADAATRGRAGA